MSSLTTNNQLRSLYFPFNDQQDKTLTCHICLDPISKEKSTAHEGGGLKHPIHIECLRMAIKKSKKNECPTCREPVNKRSIVQLGNNYMPEIASKIDTIAGGDCGILSFDRGFFKPKNSDTVQKVISVLFRDRNKCLALQTQLDKGSNRKSVAWIVKPSETWKAGLCIERLTAMFGDRENAKIILENTWDFIDTKTNEQERLLQKIAKNKCNIAYYKLKIEFIEHDLNYEVSNK